MKRISPTKNKRRQVTFTGRRVYVDKPSFTPIYLLLTTVFTSLFIQFWFTTTPELVSAYAPAPTVTPTPEPTIAPKQSLNPIEEYIIEVFGEEAENALKIARCESGMNPETVGDQHLMVINDKTGELVGDSIGIYQIRTGAKNWNRAKANGMTADEFRAKMKQYKDNIDYAKQIYDRNGWNAWENCMNKELKER